MAKQILIIDDEISIHTALEFTFKQYGIKTLHATSAKEVTAVLKENIPDLIFMDFKLPGPNGIQITKKIKSHPKLKDIPVIGLTAYASDENLEIAHQVGIKTVLEKPIDLIELQKLLNKYF